MAISAKLVKELRERTAAGMMDCKKALEEAVRLVISVKIRLAMAVSCASSSRVRKNSFKS